MSFFLIVLMIRTVRPSKEYKLNIPPGNGQRKCPTDTLVPDTQPDTALTFATYNVEKLGNVKNPAHFENIKQQIIRELKSPLIVALQEIVLFHSGSTIENLNATLTRLVDDINTLNGKSATGTCGPIENLDAIQ